MPQTVAITEAIATLAAAEDRFHLKRTADEGVSLSTLANDLQAEQQKI